ncbi:hypothetical protein ACFY0F_02055 [Streptomyces sp. NPDC001544]
MDVWHGAEVAYQRKEIASHKQRLEAQKAHDTRLVRNARTVLARSGNR